MSDFDNSDQQDDTSALNESIDMLSNAWRTELNAPEILPYKEDLVEEIQLLLNNQEELIEERYEKADEATRFTVTLYQMDIERARYSLARYLRARVLKIEDSLDFITADLDVSDRLSYKEKKFVAKMKELNDSHFEEDIFAKLQNELRDLMSNTKDRVDHATPQLEEFVFCKITEDLNNVDLSNGSSTDLITGDVHVLQYSAVQTYVLQDRILLI